MYRKLFFLISALSFLSFFLFGIEKITFVSPKKADWTITLTGYFNRKGTVKTNDVMVSYVGKHIYFPTTINFQSEYRFLGKIDDESFEIEYIESGQLSDKARKEKQIVYFIKDRLYNLHPFSMLYTKCTEKDLIYMQMFSLKDDKLQYQIILPNCLKIS